MAMWCGDVVHRFMLCAAVSNRSTESLDHLRLDVDDVIKSHKQARS